MKCGLFSFAAMACCRSSCFYQLLSLIVFLPIVVGCQTTQHPDGRVERVVDTDATLMIMEASLAGAERALAVWQSHENYVDDKERAQWERERDVPEERVQLFSEILSEFRAELSVDDPG